MSSNLQLAMRVIKLSVTSGMASATAPNESEVTSMRAPVPFAARQAAQAERARKVPLAELPTPPASPFESVRLLDPFKSGGRSNKKATASAAKSASVTNSATSPVASANGSESARPATPFGAVRLKDPFASAKGSKAGRPKDIERGNSGGPARIGAGRMAGLALTR